MAGGRVVVGTAAVGADRVQEERPGSAQLGHVGAQGDDGLGEGLVLVEAEGTPGQEGNDGEDGERGHVQFREGTADGARLRAARGVLQETPEVPPGEVDEEVTVCFGLAFVCGP